MDLRLTTIVAVQVAIEPFYLSKEKPSPEKNNTFYSGGGNFIITNCS